MRTKHPILRRDISRRQSRIERFRRCLCSVCDAGSQTVSALKGDVPGGRLERLGEPSRYLTVVWNASMSEPRHPLCEGYYTRLVGLRRSLASYLEHFSFRFNLSAVIAGLDPAIHLLTKMDGCAGQARACGRGGAGIQTGKGFILHRP